MENTRETKPQEPSNAADPEIAERINALEQQRAERSAQADAATGTAARTMTRDELSAELERHRDQVRDYEKALVERIADVDDDRRATASRLQRAWQTQREEIDERLRRNAGLVAGLLVLFAIVVAVALFLVYRQATSGQPQIAAEIAEIRQQLDGINAAAAASDQVREDLAWLSKDVEAVAVSVARLDQGTAPPVDPATQSALADERGAREEGDAMAVLEIHRLDGGQKRVAQELKTLKAAVEVLESERAAGNRGTEASAAVGTTDPPADGPGADLDSAEAAPVTIPGESSSPEGADPTSAGQDVGALDAEETLVVGEGSYALQLIGFHGRDSLATFAAREGLPARVYYLRQTHKGRPWYAMIHSIHQGYAAAADALSRLPEDLVTLNPWLRPVPTGTELQVLETGPGR